MQLAFLNFEFALLKLQQQHHPSLLFSSKLGRLEMKPHEQKKCIKQERKIKGKQRAIKNQIKKRRKDNKTLSQKSEKRARKKT
jgi:hypothetical protein